MVKRNIYNKIGSSFEEFVRHLIIQHETYHHLRRRHHYHRHHSAFLFLEDNFKEKVLIIYSELVNVSETQRVVQDGKAW